MVLNSSPSKRPMGGQPKSEASSWSSAEVRRLWEKPTEAIPQNQREAAGILFLLGRGGCQTNSLNFACALCTAPSASFRPRPLWCTVITKARHRPAASEDFSMDSPLSVTTTRKPEGSPAPRETLTITDNRTGKSYEVPITHDTIRAADLRQIKVDPKDFGMMSYDPAFNNTASCISKITFIDGDAGILRYRGYPIEDLAEKSTYLETAYLLLHGELPTASQLKDWTYNVTHHTFIHESIKKFLAGFHYDAHPMGMMFVYPDNDLSYPGNFLNMLFRTTEPKYRPNPTLERALDVLFILHADHE